MNTLAKVIAVWLLLVAVDAATGFGMYRKLVWGVSGAWCAATNRDAFQRHECTARVFYSRGVWGFMSVLVGLAAGYVSYEAMKPGGGGGGGVSKLFGRRRW